MKAQLERAEEMSPDLSISIINTDNRDQTLECLDSVFSSTHQVSLEVFVVDNACSDGSAQAIRTRFPQVRLIRNTVRKGFSTNSNLVFSRASGRYLMLLNDDTVVLDGAFDQMVAFLDLHSEAGAVGASLLDPDGTPQRACDYPPHPLFEALRPLSTWVRPMRCDPHHASKVGSVCGACMLVRREVADQVGLLDTDFDPLYSEEVEWCHRIRQADWEIYHLPQAKVIHYGGQTMNRTPTHKLDKLYEKKALFFRKHHGSCAVWLFKAALFASSLVKVLAWGGILLLRREVALAKVRSHFRVMARALFL
jgi:GT2 family glycosyltransferase